jgi:hypothetical protein
MSASAFTADGKEMLLLSGRGSGRSLSAVRTSFDTVD